MTEFSKLSIEDMLDPKGFECACGHRHASELRVFHSGAGAIKKLPETLAALGAVHPFVVCDRNTHRAAGERVEALLRAANIPYKLFIIPREAVEPDEWAVGAITMALDPACDLVLAVGSGVINDLCKVVAFAAGKPQAVVATAPSMDGYASSSSSMHVNEVKTTVYNACPAAIIADTDILAEAPMRMLWAGFGDMIAKYVSLCEWRISNLVTGEYYCEEVARLVRRSVKSIVDNADKITSRDPQVVQAITEGLVLSGVAMSFAGTSRPASGLEHYFSHLWEMMAMERHEHADLHGIQVGVGTLVTLKLYDWIRTIVPDRERGMAAMAAFDEAAWADMVRRVFGTIAPQILEIEEKTRKNDPARHAARLDKIVDHWDRILGFIEDELPDTAHIADLMRGMGAPMTPAALGISDQDAKNAYTGAREIRDKYLCCSMLWDLGLAEEARARVSAE
ncbi:sn-glycerol-1-phosphate dehydrogenase [Bacillota bacterium Meth-B3]|nr:sn-glycerol-1-phosphate dehydrogenase [Christensenellaceae bacterium]